MLNMMSSEIVLLVLIPLLTGLLQVVKKTEMVDVRFIPVLSVIFGILLGIVFTGFELKDGIIVGLYIGLSAVGLYSGATNVYNGIVDK